MWVHLSPERTDLVATGHAYVGGALTTMCNLGLLTDAEHVEWSDRLGAQLSRSEGGDA